MMLVIDAQGGIKGTIGTTKEPLPIDLEAIGATTIERQGIIIQDEHGRYWANMILAGGAMLGPYATRAETIQAELDWLHANKF